MDGNTLHIHGPGKCAWEKTMVPEGKGNFHDSKVHGAIMGPSWGRQDPGGPHVGPMNQVIYLHKKK